jgi:hypothetical protein
VSNYGRTFVHHLASGGTLEEISYTACGLAYNATASDPDWAKVTCGECQRYGPRSNGLNLPRMSDLSGTREKPPAGGQGALEWLF